MKVLSILQALCEWNLSAAGDYPYKELVMWSFDALYVISPNKLLNEMSSCRYLKRHDVYVTPL